MIAVMTAQEVKAVANKTVVTLSVPQKIAGGKYYEAAVYQAASASGAGATAIYQVLWYNGAGDGSDTETPLSSVTVFTGSLLTFNPLSAPDTYLTKAQVLAPTTARYYRLRHEATFDEAYQVYVDPLPLREAVNTTAITPNAVDGTKLASAITLNSVVTLGTGSIGAGGGKVTIDANGIALGNSPTGPNNLDFYDENGNRIGRIHSFGSGGDANLNMMADYISGGVTTLSLFSQDVFVLTTANGGLSIEMDNASYGGIRVIGNVRFDSTVKFGAAGTAISSYLSATASLNFPSIATHTTAELTITVTGAAVGDTVTVTPGAPVLGSANIEAGLVWSGHVTAANTVSVRLLNGTAAAIDPIQRTWRASVIRH